MPANLSVIVPIYNEEAHLSPSLIALAPHLERLAPGNWEFVLVNNGSRDRSLEIAQEMQAMWPLSQVLNLREANYGEALLQGLTHAKGEIAYVINVDAWDAQFLERAFQLMGEHDLILGSKRLRPEMSELHAYRRALSWGLNAILQACFGLHGTDTHGQKMIYLPRLRPFLAQIQLRRGQFDTELTLRAQRGGLRTAEIPVSIREIRPPRDLMLKKISRNLVDLFRLRKALRGVPQVSGEILHTQYFS